jgi:hypothetical protein
VKSDMRIYRRRHIINYLTRYGPVDKATLCKAIPGHLGGNAISVTKRLMDEGRLDRSLVTDLDQMEFDDA